MEPQVLFGIAPVPPIRTVLGTQEAISYGTSTHRIVTTFSINRSTFTAPVWAGKLHVFTESSYFSHIISWTEQTTGLQGSITKWNTTTRKKNIWRHTKWSSAIYQRENTRNMISLFKYLQVILYKRKKGFI